MGEPGLHKFWDLPINLISGVFLGLAAIHHLLVRLSCIIAYIALPHLIGLVSDNHFVYTVVCFDNVELLLFHHATAVWSLNTCQALAHSF
jgi:hypothetical protein